MDLPLLTTGKVRAIYDAGPDPLLMVASDRISAFDVVMAETIPDKGRVLTAMSAFWFELLADVAPNHLVSTDLADFPDGAHDPSLAGLDDVERLGHDRTLDASTADRADDFTVLVDRHRRAGVAWS